MPNANIPRGIMPVRYRSGAMYNGAANIYNVPASFATALFIGDPVIGVTNTSDGNGIPNVTIAGGAGAILLGAVVGFVAAGDPPVARTRDMTVYRAASTQSYVLIADDPDLLFEVQEDSVGGNMSLGAGGRNVDLIAGTGNTATGYSGWMLDSSTLAVTNTLTMRVLRPVERADNDLATSPTATNAKWLCSINLHAVRATLGI